MSVHTSAGTSFALTAAAPASGTQSAYEALAYTSVGEVGDLGEIPDRIYDIVTWQSLSGGEGAAKGGYTLPPQTIVVGFDPKDTGQAILDAAALSRSAYTVRISHPHLGSFYGRALIVGGPRVFGDGSAIIQRQITLKYLDILFAAFGNTSPFNAILNSSGGYVLNSSGGFVLGSAS